MKIKKSMFVVFSLLLSVIIVLSVLIAAAGKKQGADTVTEITGDGFYAETTYFKKETDYKNYLKSNALTIENENSDTEFVGAAVKKLYTADDGEQEIGSDETKSYFLSLEIKVTLDKSGHYKVTGRANWADEKSFRGEQTAEHSWFDFLSIRWGGDGNLVGKKLEADGSYHNTHEKMQLATCEANSYGGFIWMFEEKTWMYGEVMDYAEASVTLENLHEKKGNETSVKVTYIHTYDNAGGMPFFKGADLAYETTGKQWSVELDVGGIKY